MRRNWFSIAAAIFIFTAALPAHAVTSTSILPAGEGWFGPSSPLYFLAIWNEKFNAAFTLRPEKKAAEYLKLSEMRFLKYLAYIDAGEDKKAIKTLEKYKRDVERAYTLLMKIKNKPEEGGRVAESVSLSIEEHMKVMKEKAGRLPDKSREAGEAIYKDVEGVFHGAHCALLAFGGKGEGGKSCM